MQRAPVLARAKLAKVFSSPGAGISKELKLHAARRLVGNFNVKEDNRVVHWGKTR